MLCLYRPASPIPSNAQAGFGSQGMGRVLACSHCALLVNRIYCSRSQTKAEWVLALQAHSNPSSIRNQGWGDSAAIVRLHLPCWSAVPSLTTPQSLVQDRSVANLASIARPNVVSSKLVLPGPAESKPGDRWASPHSFLPISGRNTPY